MEEKKEYKLVDLPLPDHKLRSKAWRKAVFCLVSVSYASRDNLGALISDALGLMPDSPERDEILRDWRAGYEAYMILAAGLLDQLERIPLDQLERIPLDQLERIPLEEKPESSK